MNAETAIADQTVRATLVDDEARINTLPNHFGKYLLKVEDTIFAFMRHLVVEYRGGYWQFFELSNGGFYMAPQGERVTVRVHTNGYYGEMSSEAAGITACLFAFSELSFRTEDQTIAEHFHWLRDFALTHSEWEQIAAAID